MQEKEVLVTTFCLPLSFCLSVSLETFLALVSLNRETNLKKKIMLPQLLPLFSRKDPTVA